MRAAPGTAQASRAPRGAVLTPGLAWLQGRYAQGGSGTEGLGAGGEGRRKYTLFESRWPSCPYPWHCQGQRGQTERGEPGSFHPHTSLSSLSFFRNVFPSPPSHFLLVGHPGSWGATVCLPPSGLWAASCSPRYSSHSLWAGRQASWVSRRLLAQGCPAGHQRVAKLVSFLRVGRAFSRAGRCQESRVGDGRGPRAPSNP